MWLDLLIENSAQQDFSAWQARQGAKGGKVSKGGGRPKGTSNSGLTKPELLGKIQEMKIQGYSNRMIAEDLRILLAQ